MESSAVEEQNAGRVVDYFYRMEFHSTPRFFSDSNYLFFFFMDLFFWSIIFQKTVYSGEIFTFPPLVPFQKLVADFTPLASLVG